jgi:hypothetical protein
VKQTALYHDMHSARLRSLYDSEAVLRRTASVLRAIGTSESTAPRPAIRQRLASAPDTGIRFSEAPSRRHAALTAALRRSREVLEALDRRMAIRDTLSTSHR